MELEFALLADRAEANDQGRFFVFNGGVDGVTSPSLPATIPSLAAIVKMRVMPHERDVPHTVAVRIQDPDGQVIAAPVAIPVQIKPDGVPPERPLFFLFISNYFGIPITRSGEYKIVILGDGREIRELPLFVDLPRVIAVSTEE